MKLLKAKLVGYKGLYNGLGLTTFNLDLTKSRHPIIMIKGNNGSGKSTLFNALHMFPDNNSVLIDNMECRKELLYICDGILYTIKIIHGVNKSGRIPTKAYLIKETPNGEVILNPNGNVSSYLDALEEEFLLDSNFQSLSQLGVEDRGIVDMKPSERKKFVGSILKETEIYNEIYKSVSSKSAIYKNSINSIASKINTITNNGDIVSLTEKKNSIDKTIKNFESKRNYINQKVIELESKLSSYDPSVIETLKTLKEDIESINRNKSQELINFNTKLNTLAYSNKCVLSISETSRIIKEINFVKSKINKIDEEYLEINKVINDLMIKNESLLSKIEDRNNFIESLKDEENYTDYIEELKKIKEEKAKFEPIVKSFKIHDIQSMSSEQLKNGLNSVKKIAETFDTIRSCTELDIIEKSIERLRNNMNTSLYDELSKGKESLSLLANQINEELIENYKRIEKYSILKNRPKECKINNCYFIKDAISIDIDLENQTNKILLEKSNKIKEEISNIDMKLKEESKINDFMVKYMSVLKGIIDSNAYILKKISTLNHLANINNIYELLITGYSFPELDSIDEKIVNSNIIDIYKDLSIKEDKYSVYEINYNKQQKKLEQTLNELENLNQESSKLLEKINLNKDVNQNHIENKIKFESELMCLEELLEIANKYKDYSNLLIPKEHEYELILKSNIDIESVQKEIDLLNNEIFDIENNLVSLNKEKSDIDYKIRLYSDYQEELKALNDEYKKIELIKKATSTSTGIQTVFMSIYMNKILSTANNLLSFLFNGEFELGRFIINQREFRIPCYGNGLVNEDISTMSTSQKCMMSLVLSFALLCQSSIKYNILKLDEIDGGLDNDNRSIFVDTLYRLIDLLKSEQCFIISHNNEMNIDECDLIVLRSTDTYQGNILYNYNN